MLALAITLLAAATFGILYAAVAQGQDSDGAITGLTLSSDTPGTLTVSWDPSSPDPTDHRVNWAKSSEDYASWTSDDGNLYPTATSVDLTGLDPGVEYKVRVRARYRDGDDADSPWSGPWAQESLQVAAEEPQGEEETPTPEPEPTATPEPEATPEPGALGNVTAEDTGTLGLLISWQAPAEPHDQPTDYRVNWAKSRRGILVLDIRRRQPLPHRDIGGPDRPGAGRGIQGPAAGPLPGRRRREQPLGRALDGDNSPG